jgi:protein-S-isoprenylcysteine O-methyltransferase Ste14
MSQETLIRWILTGLFLTAVSVSMFHRRKADVSGGETVSRLGEPIPIRIGLRVGGLLFWLSTILYLINPTLMNWSSISLPLWLRWAGIAGVALATGLLIWMFRSLGQNITDTVGTRKDHALITNGPYRWIRHPLYTFATFFFLSFSLAAGNWFIALMALVAFGLLTTRTPIEEAKLVERFGDDYKDYMQETGRYLPRLG